MTVGLRARTRQRASPLHYKLVLAASVLVFGCGRYRFDELHDGDDAGGPDANEGCSLGTWDTTTSLTSISSTANDQGPALHPNNLEIVFHSNRTGEPRLYFARRPAVDEAFEAPITLALDGSLEYQAEWSSDGSELHYISQSLGPRIRPYLGDGSFGPGRASDLTAANGLAFSDDMLEVFFSVFVSPTDYQLSHATRPTATSAWQYDSLLDGFNRSGEVEGFPSFDEPRQTLYLQYATTPGSGIHTTTRAARGAPFGPLVDQSAVIGPSDDPDVSRDGLSLTFASDRAGGLGGWDLYQTTRACL